MFQTAKQVSTKMGPEIVIVKFTSILISCRNFVLQVLLSVLILLCSPLALLSIPIFLWRIVIKYAAKIFRKDLSKMLTTRGQMFAVDKLHKTPKCNVVVTLVGEGNVENEAIRSFLVQKLIDSPPKDSFGVERYPELKQYLVKWGGYYFWKQCENFSLEDHFTIIDDGKIYTEEDMKALAQKYTGLAWPKGKPLWGIVFVKNYEPKNKEASSGPQTACLLRVHHSLGDGYSFLYFLIEVIAGREVISVVPNYFLRSLPLLFVYAITFPFRAAWEVAELVMSCLHSFSVRLYMNPNKKLVKGPEGCTMKADSSGSIPIDLVKDIKNHFKTSFAAVQFAAMAGAVRDFHLEKGLKTPHSLPCLTVLPYPGHKLYKFRNHMGGAVVNLPIHETDPIKRLQFCQRDYNKVKRSTFPVLSFYALSALGCYVWPITRFILKHHPIPTGISSFPAGFQEISILGLNWKDCVGYIGTFEGNAGLSFVSLSLCDAFRMSAVGHPSIFSQEDIRRLIKLVEYHLDLLHRQIKMDV